jgi:hypothetical protein
VSAVADEWGVEQRPPGKVVWAEFDRTKRDGPSGGSEDDEA